MICQLVAILLVYVTANKLQIIQHEISKCGTCGSLKAWLLNVVRCPISVPVDFHVSQKKFQGCFG